MRTLVASLDADSAMALKVAVVRGSLFWLVQSSWKLSALTCMETFIVCVHCA